MLIRFINQVDIMSITMYGLPQCGTCKKAMAWLDGQGLDHQFINYRTDPIDPALLRQWAAAQGWPKVVNRASMTWRKLDDALKDPQSDADWLALIKEYDALVRRPVLVHDGGVHFGFNEKKWFEQLC